MTERDPETAAGRCVCGSVRYQLMAPPLIVHCCHCSWCQRETGSAFAINALIELSELNVLSGDLDELVLASNSGQGQKIMRCRICDTRLWSHYAYAGIGEKVAFVRTGTLDNPDALPPDLHIYTASRQEWVLLPEHVPAHEAYYKASERWTPSALARRQRLFDSGATG